MKILQLTKKFPFPTRDGESIAILNLAKGLSSIGNKVTLLAMNTSKHRYKGNETPRPLSFYQKVYKVEVDNKVKAIGALKNLFTSNSYHIERFISESYTQKLIQLLRKNDFDVVQLETIYLAPYIDVIKKYSKAKIVLRSHNVEHEIWNRIAKNTNSILKKWYLKLLAKRLMQFEIQKIQAVDAIVAITDRDAQSMRALGSRLPSIVCPIGIDQNEADVDFSAFQKTISFGFLGALDWTPNMEGLIWFVENIWSEVVNKYPEVQFHVAGRNTPDTLHNKKWKNVVIHGEVESAVDFTNQHSTMIVPLLSGSGMRAKILEAMSLGRVVITTDLGVEGIPAKDNLEILKANSTKAMVETLAYCIENQSKLLKIGQRAQQFAQKYFDNLEIAQGLNTFLHQIVETEEALANEAR